jgi:hypothetical protein
LFKFALQTHSIMNDRMKEMYRSGGLLKALLKDPSQRKMAADMLASNSGSVIDGNAGRGGTKRYVAGGSVEERIKTMLGAPAGFNPGAKDQYAMGGAIKYRMGGNMPRYENGGEPKGTKYSTRVAPSRKDVEEAIKQSFSLGTGGMPATVEELIALGPMDSGDLSRVMRKAEEIAEGVFNRSMQSAQGLPRTVDEGRMARVERNRGAGAVEEQRQRAYNRPERAQGELRDEYGDRVIETAYRGVAEGDGYFTGANQIELDAINETNSILKAREEALLREMGLM